MLAAAALQELGEAATQTLAKANIKAAVTTVSQSLGNTPAICRKCYIHPGLMDAYLAGELKLPRTKRVGLSPHEASVLAFLDHKPRRRTASRS